jgi:hypothetical protein
MAEPVRVMQVGFELDLPRETAPSSHRRLTRGGIAVIAAAAVVAAEPACSPASRRRGLLSGARRERGGLLELLGLGRNADTPAQRRPPASITSGNGSIWVT